jgi:sortase A
MATAKWIERILIVFGVACLGYYGYVAASAASFQREQRQRFEQVRLEAPPPRQPGVPRTDLPGDAGHTERAIMSVSDERSLPLSADGAHAVVGLLEIPRLGISTPVVSGDDDQALDIAVGHLPDTPLPWQPGNSAVAAHRDGLFRPLKNVRAGDRIVVRTTRGDLEYQVRETKIVRPTDVSVLAPLDADALTLITCYPFNYIGSAPQRFIVHAIRTPGDTAADGLLPSRSVASLARYSTATARPIVRSAPANTAASLRRPSAPARSLRAKKAAPTTVRASRRADASTVARDKRGRDAVSKDRRKASAVAKADKGDDERPRKRRWYHIFTGR